MAIITLKGSPINTVGALPAIDTTAPDFTLTTTDLSEISLKSCLAQGKNVLLNIFPSIDTPTCATSVRRFNELINQRGNTLVLCVSADLPFAQKRFCGAENLTHIIPASTFRHPEFGTEYGVTISDGPVAGLLSRAIVIINQTGQVKYTEQVAELSEEPHYSAALAILEQLA